MTYENDVTPSHKCRFCGALWRFFRKGESGGFTTDVWSNCSNFAGDCCAEKPIVDQMAPVTLIEIERYIVARKGIENFISMAQNPGKTVH